MSMKVIPPLAITTARLTSSTVAEPDTGEAAYNTGTTYALDAQVISTTTHRKYQSLQASNLNKPLPVLPETTTLWWQDIGPTNRYAMFDLLRNTATSGASPLTIVLTPGVRVDALALMGLVATSVTITMTSGGPTVYSYSADLNTRDVTDWYGYYFLPFTTQPSVTLFDLPPYTNGIITITIINTAGAAQCGACVVGQAVDLGEVQYDAESDVLNFSTVTRDKYAVATFNAQRNVPKTVQAIWCEKSRVNAVRAARDTLNATPAVWVGLPDDTDGYAESLRILGFYRRFSISLKHPTIAVISLELEEV